MRFLLSFPELHRGRSSILPRLGQTWPTPGTLRDLIDFYQLLLTSLGAICCETAFTPLTRHMDHMGAELNPGPMWGDWKLPLRQAELFRKGWMFYEPLFFCPNPISAYGPINKATVLEFARVPYM